MSIRFEPDPSRCRRPGRRAPRTRPLRLLAWSLSLALPAAAAVEDAAELPDPGSTLLDSPTVEIELDLTSRRPVVQLLVDGQGPYPFVVDSGASFSLLDEAIAEELGLEVVGRQAIRSPGAGAEIEGRRVRAGRLEVGGLSIEGPVLATMDLDGMSGGSLLGVLGRPHFRDLLMTYDYPSAKLRVTRGRLDPSDPEVVAIEDGVGDVRFTADVDGELLPMVVDTGSPGGLSLPKALEPRLRFTGPLRSGPTIGLVGGSYPTWRGRLAGEVRLAGLRYPEPEVTLTSIVDDYGHLGYEILRELEFTLDQASGLLRLRRPNATTPTAVRAGGPVPAGGSGPRLGVAFEMTPLGFVHRDGGLPVRHVDSNGAAAQAGLAAGDIVLSIGDRAASELQSAAAIGGALRGPRPLRLVVRRDGVMREILIP